MGRRSAIPLFRAVDLALDRATFYLRPDWFYPAFPVLAEEVGFEPTGQVKADTTDFKSVRLCPLAHSSILSGFSYQTQSHMAPYKDCNGVLFT